MAAILQARAAHSSPTARLGTPLARHQQPKIDANLRKNNCTDAFRATILTRIAIFFLILQNSGRFNRPCYSPPNASITAMNRSSSKTIYGLIGMPLAHSLSRDYFNSKFAAEGINAEYRNFELPDINLLGELVADLPNLGGLNVTAPYKQQVMPFLTSIHPTAQAIGAVNVIRVERDPDTGEVSALVGHNTDADAFAGTLAQLLPQATQAALVLGTGGAAMAVAHALRQRGVDVQLVSRHKRAGTMTYEELTRATVACHTLVVNATPLGKWPHVEQCPLFPYRFLTPQHLCYDLVYNPEEPLFMRHAAQAGARTKNGLEMLLLQAFASYRLWTQSQP